LQNRVSGAALCGGPGKKRIRPENLAMWAPGCSGKLKIIQNSLISLHFGNPKLHNKLLASRHPTWDDVQTFRFAKQSLIGSSYRHLLAILL
jgi:hypothetical protein